MSTNAKNIAVIGAGIMGLCAARTLSAAGHNVVLHEKNEIPTKNASYLAGGMLAPYSEIEHMPLPWVQAGLDSIDIWQNLKQGQETVTEFTRAGSLFIAHDEDQYVLQRFKNHLPASPNCREVMEEELTRLEPQIAERFSNGIFLKEEAHLHPQKTIDDLIKNASFEIKQEEAAPNDLSKQYDLVIDCRGYDAESDDFALRGVKGEIIIVHNPDFQLQRPVRLMHPRYPLYIVPRKGNKFMIGATVIESASDEHVSVRSALELLSALYSLHPSFSDANIIEVNAGIRPAYGDNLPRIKQKENVIRCNGLFRHGFLLAPIMAECLEHMVGNKQHKYTALFTGEKYEGDYQRTRAKLRSAA